MTTEEDVVIIKDLVKVRYHLKFTMHVLVYRSEIFQEELEI